MVQRHYVDVSNLEKVDAEDLEAEILFGINKFDDELIFRDRATQEVFVFDRSGVWNEDTLAHPLIN